MRNRIKDWLVFSAVKRTVAHVKKDPDKKVARLIHLSHHFVKTDFYERRIQDIENKWHDKDNYTCRIIRRVLDTLSQNVTAKLLTSFIINGAIKAGAKQEELREQTGINIPWAILMDPTSACNLNCKGCWAAEYSHSDTLSYDTLDSIIRQGKEMGVHYFLYSGGEPLVRKKDLVSLAEKHSDCMFMAFTNGTLIDEQLASKLEALGNFAFAISVEGFKHETDARRGAGTYLHVMRAMDILRRHGILFGFSACYTSENYDVIGSDAFIDLMMEKGCLFGWLFTYIPIGKNALPDLIAKADQREYMYHFVRRVRSEKPIFLLDFWNDGEFSGGCIAGGRRYLHINARGDVEPCAFIHYSSANIHDMTLMEALKQPLFLEYHDHQPFNENHLRPCPLLDNPEMLCHMISSSGARSTQPADKENAETLTAKTQQPAENWAAKAASLWEESHGA